MFLSSLVKKTKIMCGRGDNINKVKNSEKKIPFLPSLLEQNQERKKYKKIAAGGKN